ncbi:MAG: radical SAM protein, partial [bacterium]|nr:radical SAM protein [bacterium]
MNISLLAFTVTEACNYNCSYCYQESENKPMARETIEKAVPFFYPFLHPGENEKEIFILFYGGEPLLAFDTIVHTVELFQKHNTDNKSFHYSLTTNGSLVTAEMLDFFHRNRFSIALSFDGPAQDSSRHPGSFEQSRELIDTIGNYSGIEFSINSVFSPQTVAGFSQSMAYIIETGVGEITFNFATQAPWHEKELHILEEELEKLKAYMVGHYKAEGKIPVTNFRERKNPAGSGFMCGGGGSRMAVAAGGEVWGCLLFRDYLKNKRESPEYAGYSFGNLDEFKKNHE